MRLRSLLLCTCSICDVNCSSAFTSHCLIILKEINKYRILQRRVLLLGRGKARSRGGKSYSVGPIAQLIAQRGLSVARQGEITSAEEWVGGWVVAPLS